MNYRTQKLLRAICHEAQVIDFDFSEWDRRVRLVVIAWLGRNFPGRGALHNIDFLDVRSLSWESRHLGITLDSPKQRFQWHILQAKVRREKGECLVELSTLGPGPDVRIKCRDVGVSKLNRSVVHRINPNWGMPDTPLARPGFKELYKMIRRRS